MPPFLVKWGLFAPMAETINDPQGSLVVLEAPAPRKAGNYIFPTLSYILAENHMIFVKSQEIRDFNCDCLFCAPATPPKKPYDSLAFHRLAARQGPQVAPNAKNNKEFIFLTRDTPFC